MNRLYIAIGILLCLASAAISIAMVWTLCKFFSQLSDIGIVLALAAFAVGSAGLLAVIRRAV